MTASRAAQRTIPLRRWLLIGFIMLTHIPILVMAIFAVAWLRGPHDAREQALDEVRGSVASWDDPAWRSALDAKYGPQEVNFVFTEGDTEIYRSVDDPFIVADGSQRSVEVARVEAPGSDPARAIYVYANDEFGPPETLPVELVIVVGTLAFLLTVVGLGLYLGRSVIGPLSAAGSAAHQVAAGDLDITLPGSRIHEVNELNSAINSMSIDLGHSLRQQSAMEQERRMLIGAVVHDLRTPLFSLRGYLEGLKTGVADTPEKQRRYVDVAQEKADALERLISDLFDFTRLEYLDETPVHDNLNLADLLQSLINGISPQAETKGVEVRLLGSSDCPVRGDRHLLTRAIENLLDNAMRHTPAGGVIEVACTAEKARVVFEVSDSGTGITAEDMPHLFTPLFRGETSRNRRTGGAGLGLAIARRIVRSHGGDLSADNAPLGGARFVGWLPVSDAGV